MTSSIKRAVRKEWSKVARLFTRKKNVRGKLLLRSDGLVEVDWKIERLEDFKRRGCVLDPYDMKEGK